MINAYETEDGVVFRHEQPGVRGARAHTPTDSWLIPSIRSLSCCAARASCW